MIGLQTESKLANFFKTILDGEIQIEEARKTLADQNDFEPNTAFKRIDRLVLGFLTFDDINRFLRENQVLVSDQEVKNFIKIYDYDLDGRLSFTEFTDAVLPATSASLRLLCTSRSPYYVGLADPLPYKTEWALSKVIHYEIDLLRRVQLLKEEMNLRYDWNTMQAFSLIDVDRLGFINHDSLHYFLRKNEIIITHDDVDALLRRIDRNRLGRLNFSSFADVVEITDPVFARNQLNASIASYERRKSLSPSRVNSSMYSPSKKTTTAEYIDYVNESTKLAGRDLRESRLDSPSRRSPTRRSPDRYTSPSRLTGSPKRILSPMKGNEEMHLAIGLKQQIDSARVLENTKNELAMRSDFNLLDAFRFFDKIGKGFIDKYELELGMKNFSIFPTPVEAYLVLRKYDNDCDNLLKYAEFRDMVSPISKEYESILSSRPPTYVNDMNLDLIFSYETRKIFSNVLRMLIENEVNSEALRQKLNRRPLFNIYEAFKALDKTDTGYLGIGEFKELLLSNGIYATSQDLLNLVARYDQNQDGLVSYSEFVQEITPKSPTRM